MPEDLAFNTVKAQVSLPPQPAPPAWHRRAGPGPRCGSQSRLWVLAPAVGPSPGCESQSRLWPHGAKPPSTVVPALVPVPVVMLVLVHPTKDQPRAFSPHPGLPSLPARCFWAIISLWEQFP